MKRLGALVAAVALVVAAVWIRGRLEGGDGGAGPAGGSRLTCATEVYRACEALVADNPDLQVTTEDAGTTERRLATLDPDSDPGFDVWLTTTPYSEIAPTTTPSPSAGRLGEPSPPLAHARLGFWVEQSRAPALEAHCAGQVDWSCLLSAVPNRWEAIGGDPAWGPLKPHIDDPSGSAGLLALGNAAAVLIGPDADALAVEENSAYIAAITGLSRARVKENLESGAALNRMLAAGPAEIDVVIALESEGARFGEAAAARAQLIYPSPVAVAVVQAVPRSGEDKRLEKLMELVKEQAPEALRSTGWRPGAGPRVDGMPSLGGLLSIRRIWEEIR